MADIQKAIDYVMRQEDSTLSGVVTSTPDGKRTRFGIDEHYHPTLSASLFYTSMGKDAALGIAEGIYASEYCEPLCIEDMADQDIANKVLSLGINMSAKTAAKLLQKVLDVPVDGSIGAVTMCELSASDPVKVLAGLRDEAELYYMEVIANHPEDLPFKKGWLARANA